MLPTPMRVARVRRETADTVSLLIDAAERPMAFRPGQFNMLYAFAVGDIPISMSGDPERTTEIVHTIKAVGAVTEALCDLRRGGWVGVRGPYGKSWPVDEVKGKDVILVAGGVGLAPLRSAIYHILAHRADYGRLAILVGARTPGDLLFHRELERWNRRDDVTVLVTVDRAGADWRGRVGVVPAVLAEISVDPARTVAFICGPEVMMRFTIREAARRGLTNDKLYLAMERNMKCAVGFCGHCQYGPAFVCKDGPVFPFAQIERLFYTPEI